MKFSIRDLMLASAAVVLATGWMVDRQRLTRRNSEMEFQLNSSQSLLETDGWKTSVDQRGVVFDRHRGERSELDRQIQAAIARSAELGAPQPAPLPHGYGAKPDKALAR